MCIVATNFMWLIIHIFILDALYTPLQVKAKLLFSILLQCSSTPDSLKIYVNS